MSLPQFDELKDPALFAEVELARAAAQEEAGDEEVGAHVETQVEGDAAVTHLFDAAKPGYRGWRWAATVSSAGPGTNVTVSEVVLLPGPDALVAPDWVPWENRVQAGDLGVGDLLPTAPDDPRLVPAYVRSDDPAVEEAALETGLGRVRVMSRAAREDAAARWRDSAFGPRSDMARSAPAHCGTCGFYLPLAGSLRAAFGTCGNEISPADGHVVHAEYGCGAHSEAEVEQVSPVLVANLIYDDAQLDVEPLVPAARVEAGPTRKEEPATEAPLNGAGPAEVAVSESGSPDEPASTTQAEPAAVELDSSDQAEATAEPETVEPTSSTPAEAAELAGPSQPKTGEPATAVETTEPTSPIEAETTAPETFGSASSTPAETTELAGPTQPETGEPATAVETTEPTDSIGAPATAPEAAEATSFTEAEPSRPETTESASSINATHPAETAPTEPADEPAMASQPDTTDPAGHAQTTQLAEPAPAEVTQQADSTQAEPTQPDAPEPASHTEPAEATPSEPASAAPDTPSGHTPPHAEPDNGADPRPTEG